MNSVNLTGRITKDPELKPKSNGEGSYLFFCLAVDAGKDKTGEKLTEFIDCLAYNQQASFLSSYARKGDLIELSGRIHTSSVEDSAGNKTKRYIVIANNVGIASSKQREQSPAQAQATATPSEKIATPIEPATPDSLPFELCRD